MIAENMNINYKHYINYKQYEDIDQFIKVHESFCKGTFTTSLNVKNSLTHQKVCKACGTIAYTQIGEYRTQAKVFFKGFIRYDKIGLERPQTQYGNKQFNNHCVACGEHFKSNTRADYCPGCTQGNYEESYTNYDSIAESHAGSQDKKVWQQGQLHEVNTEHIISNGMHSKFIYQRIKALKANNGIFGFKRAQELERIIILKHTRKEFRMSSIEEIDEKYEKKRKCDYVRNEIIPAEKAERHDMLKARGFYAMTDNLLMADLEKQIKENPCMTYRLRKEYAILIKRTPRRNDKKPSTQGTFKDVPLMLYECESLDKLPTPNTEVIEVTREANAILSPSWKTRNQYRADKDKVKFIGAFMQEMNKSKPRAAMMDIIEKAKDHPVYLIGSSVHRVLITDWIKRLATV